MWIKNMGVFKTFFGQQKTQVLSKREHISFS